MKRHTFCTLTLEVFNLDTIVFSESYSKVGHFSSVLNKKGMTLKPHKQKLFTSAFRFLILSVTMWKTGFGCFCLEEDFEASDWMKYFRYSTTPKNELIVLPNIWTLNNGGMCDTKCVDICNCFLFFSGRWSSKSRNCGNEVTEDDD